MVGRPVDVETGPRAARSTLVPNANVLGQEAEARQGRLQVHRRHRGRGRRPSRPARSRSIYPQAQLELEPSSRRLPDTEFDVIDRAVNYEALWFNTAKPPLDDSKVRQALAYAIDRDAIVNALFGPVQPDIEPIQAFMTPANKQWYTRARSRSTSSDLDKVDELMTGDGWAKGADGIWAKGGKKAVSSSSRPRPATSAVSSPSRSCRRSGRKPAST